MVVNADDPSAGYYRHRSGGKWTAVRIWHDASRRDPDFPENRLDRAPVWRVEIDGFEGCIDDVWPYVQPIDREVYIYLMSNPGRITRITAHEVAEFTRRKAVVR